MKQEKRLAWRKGYTHLLVLLGAIVLIAVAVVFGDRVKDFERYGYFGVLLMGIIGSASPIWPMPGSWAAFIAAGLGWNPLLVGLAAGSGEALGELTGYMAGYGGHPVVKDWRLYGRLEGWMRRRGSLVIFLVSAVPNNIIKLATAAAGALRFPLWKFFLVCWLGKTLKSLGFAVAGAWTLPWLTEFIQRLIE